MYFYRQLKTMPSKIILSLENQEISLTNYFLTFLFVIFLRNFAESYSQESNYLNLPSELLTIDIVHYTLSYITLALFLIILFYYATRIQIEKLLRVILPCFIVLLLTPLLDLLFTLGEGVNILYMQPGYEINLLRAYLTYCSGFIGVSLGIKIEVIIALISCFFYFRVKNLNILLSVFYTWVCYSIIFLWGASPYFIKWLLELTGFTYIFSGVLMVHFYLVVIFIFGSIVFYLGNRNTALMLLKDLRPLRLLHYELMLVLGVVLGLAGNSDSISVQLYLDGDIIIHTVLCMISCFFSGLFAIMMNNISDRDIDRVSNTHRPLIQGTISVDVYKNIAYVFLGLSLFYAAMVGSKALLVMGVTLASYYIYSMPPLRFKRVTLFSKSIIALNSVALIVLGYVLVKQEVYYFPTELFFIYFIGYTLAANFIDLKDVRGDSAAGIVTLPVLLGDKKAKQIIGAAFWLTYISFFCLVKNFYLLPVVIAAGGVQFYLINRVRYQEWLVLAFYNASIVFLILYLLIRKIYLI